MMYENRVVLFMDILGFTHLINSTQDNEGIVDNIHEILNYIIDRVRRFPEIFPSAIVTHFSDSFIISFKYGEKGISLSILETLQQLQKDLIFNYRIIVRGGMTIGKLYHSEQYIFGPAMIEAYLLESKDAIYPRIILSDVLCKCIIGFPDSVFDGNEDVNKSYIYSCLAKDAEEKFFYINYYNYNSFGDLSIGEKTYVRALYDFIFEKLQTSSEEKVLQKFRWMKQKYNAYVEKLKRMKPYVVEETGISLGYDASADEWYQSLRII